MKIAIIGYGKMGHMIEEVALSRGHEIVCIIDTNVTDISKAKTSTPIFSPETGFFSSCFQQADVAIEFTTPQTAEKNILDAWKQNVRIVCGTTGWDTQSFIMQEKENLVHTGLIWSSNYSLGVNLLFAVNQYLAEIIKVYPEYAPSICETHHIHKLDAPSGTAKTLAEQIMASLPSKQEVPIESIREGEVPGIHTITWDSEVDTITLRHNAKSRKGFALGAVIAAEWLKGKNGFHTMQEVMGFTK